MVVREREEVERCLQEIDEEEKAKAKAEETRRALQSFRANQAAEQLMMKNAAIKALAVELD